MRQSPIAEREHGVDQRLPEFLAHHDVLMGCVDRRFDRAVVERAIGEGVRLITDQAVAATADEDQGPDQWHMLRNCRVAGEEAIDVTSCLTSPRTLIGIANAGGLQADRAGDQTGSSETRQGLDGGAAPIEPFRNNNTAETVPHKYQTCRVCIVSDVLIQGLDEVVKIGVDRVARLIKVGFDTAITEDSGSKSFDVEPLADVCDVESRRRGADAIDQNRHAFAAGGWQGKRSVLGQRTFVVLEAIEEDRNLAKFEWFVGKERTFCHDAVGNQPTGRRRSGLRNGGGSSRASSRSTAAESVSSTSRGKYVSLQPGHR